MSSRTHIHHIEEIALMDPEMALSFLRDPRNASVKIDGIQLVFGRDEEGFFVSNQSFFNKTSVRHRCYADILNSVKYPALREKLTTALLCLRDFEDLTGIHTADIIESSHCTDTIIRCPSGNMGFQANIIVYDTGIPYDDVAQCVVLAPHDMAALPASFKTNKNVLVIDPRVEVKPADLRNIEIPSGYLPAGIIQVMMRHANWEIRNKVAPTKDPLIRFNGFSKFVHENNSKYWCTPEKLNANADLILEYFDFTDAIVRAKEQILSSGFSFTALTPLVERGDELEPWEHEGLVLKNADGQAAKLVNRRNFSALNFDESASRGWSLTDK